MLAEVDSRGVLTRDTRVGLRFSTVAQWVRCHSLKSSRRVGHTKAHEVWPRTRWLTCRFRCSVIRIHCNAIQTLLQLNSYNYKLL